MKERSIQPLQKAIWEVLQKLKSTASDPTSSNCSQPFIELLAPGCAALSYSVLFIVFIGLRGLAALGIGSFFSRKKN